MMGGATGVQGIRIVGEEGWVDRSMLVLTMARPNAGGISPNLVVTREPLPGSGEGADAIARRVEAHVDAQVEGWRGRPGYEEVMRRRATAADPTAELRLVWTDGDQPLAQWLVFAPAAAATVIAAACTATRADIAQVEPQARRMLDTLQVD